MLKLLPFEFLALLLFLLFLVFLVLLGLYSITILQLSQPKGVGHECLVSSLLLLFDREKRVFPYLGGNVPSGVGILNRNKVLVGCAELGVLVRCQNLVNSLLTK
jgi:hypothetical protein